MKEVGDDFSYCFLIVDEGFKNLGCSSNRDNIVISYGSRHETGIALRNGYFIACTSYFDLAVTIQHHHYNERVILDHIAMEWLCGLDDLDAEVWGIEYLIGCTYILTMVCTVFWIYVVVDGF